MPPRTNDSSKLKIGRHWDDGFVNQRLLGLGVAGAMVGTLLGIRQLVTLLLS